MTNTATLDWVNRLKARKVPMNTELLPMETPEAIRISKVLSHLKIPDLDGQPATSEMPNFGWIDAVARATFGDNIIRETFVLVGKKSAKSAGFGLVFLAAFLTNKRPAATFTILAPSVGVANLVFGIVSGAIAADQTLAKMVHLRRHTKELEHRGTGAILTVKAFTPDSVTGLRGNILLDEVHLLGASTSGARLRAQVKGALAANPDAKVIYVSTQSDTPPRGMFNDLLQYSRAVRDGTIEDDTFLPVLWEPWKSSPDPMEDPAMWPILLPSFPALGDEKFYKAVVAEAKQSGPSAVAIAASQFFNVEMGVSLNAGSWALSEQWPNLAQRRLPLAEIISRCERIGIGIDLGGSEDLTAIGVVGVDDETGEWLIWSRAWCLQAALDRNRQERAVMEDCISAGDLMIVKPGGDLPPIVDICLQVSVAGKLHAIGIDPAGAADLMDALENAGFNSDPDTGDIMGIGQGAARLNPAIQTLTRKALEGRIEGDASTLMQWTLGNVGIVERGQAQVLERINSMAKVDPVYAVLDAASTLVLRRPVIIDISAMLG